MLGYFLGTPSSEVQAQTPKSRLAGVAPRTGMAPEYWASGVKQIFGTSFEAYDDQNQFSGSSPTAPISKVWFTGAQGVLSEVMWPTVDVAQVRDHQFLVTDGKTFFFEERKDSISSAFWIEKGIPAFQVVNRDPQGRFAIERSNFIYSPWAQANGVAAPVD